MISIPPEIDDLIGEFVSSLQGETAPRTPLLTFALTSRAWLAVGRKHIFSSLKLESAKDVITFLEILDSSPIIGPFVRLLIADGSNAGWDKGNYEPKLPMMRNGPLSPLLAPHLPNLKRLELLPSILQRWTTEEIDVLKMFPSVTEFTIRECCCTYGVLYNLLCAFPHLATFVIDKCSEREEGDLDTHTGAMDILSAPSSSLKELRLIGWLNDLCSDGGLIHAISMKNGSIALRSLDIAISDGDVRSALPRICTLFEALADSLVELTLDIYYDILEPRIHLASSAVSKCTKLNTLRLQSDIYQSTILFLCHLSIPSLEHIFFDLSRVEHLNGIFGDDLSHPDLSLALSQAVKNCDVKEITFAMNPMVKLSDMSQTHYKTLSSSVQLKFIHRDPGLTTWLKPRAWYDSDGEEEEDSDGTIDSIDSFDEEHGYFDDDFGSDELEESDEEEWDEY